MLKPKVGDRILLECSVREIIHDRVHVHSYTFPISAIREILRPVLKVGDTVVYDDRPVKIIHLFAENTRAVVIRSNGHPIFVDNVEKLSQCADS